jgi:hypothetical protein
MGPATNSKKRTASKENASTKANKVQKVSANDEVSDRAGNKQTKKADRRRSFGVAAWRLLTAWIRSQTSAEKSSSRITI